MKAFVRTCGLGNAGKAIEFLRKRAKSRNAEYPLEKFLMRRGEEPS